MRNDFPETYQVLVDYDPAIGRAFAEVRPGETIEDVAFDIFRGEFCCDAIIGVYRTGLGIVTTDVSSQVADMIVDRFKRGESPSRLARDFVSYVNDREHQITIEEFEAAE